MFEDIERVIARGIRDLDLNSLIRDLRETLILVRKRSYGRRYLFIGRASELTREVVLVADCGLQKDIRKSISEGRLSYNNAWQSLARSESAVARAELQEATSTPLWQQLHAVFSNHKIDAFSVAIVRCSDHESVVFVDAFSKESEGHSEFSNCSDDQLATLAERVYFAFLKDFRSTHISDWEKVVHELASPLDFIYSNSDFLLQFLESPSVDKAKKRKKLEDFRNVATLLINRLHQFRFAFSGTDSFTVHRQEVDLFNLLMPLTHLMYHDYKRKKLKVVYDGIRGFKLRTDKDAIRYIFFNLISNAIKYSNERTAIHLNARLHDHTQDWVTLSIRNKGIGIAEIDRERIYDLGYRSEEARRKDARGMGIGLTVCRQLARKLGGRINLSPTGGDWTEFELHIPG